MDTLYEEYKGSMAGFEEFNNLVLNMPRPTFSNVNIDYLKSLAKILYKINYDTSENLSIVDLYCKIHELYQFDGDLPEYLKPLFNKDVPVSQARKNYSDTSVGRYFRQYAEVMELWGLLKDDDHGLTIAYDVCEEFIELDSDESESIRMKMIAMDIEDNSCFIRLSNIKDKIRNKTIFSYKPAVMILRYMEKINRPVSKFELANLLAIITPLCKSKEELFDNAIKIGNMMPSNITEHKNWFFDFMNWKNADGTYFNYASSQNPDFRFNSFIAFMKEYGFINQNEDLSYVLTEESLALLHDTIPPEIAELEKYIDIAENEYSDKSLADIILKGIKPSLLYSLSQNEDFIKTMNKRSIARPRFDSKGKKIRNRLIAELSKIRVNYTCQVSNRPTFKDINGHNYVESHHIIEINGEDGPDIIDNLLVVSPLYHELMHHACKEELTDFYMGLRMKNIVTIDTFKTMIINYHCLEEKHIKALLNKHLITKDEYYDLVDFINENVVAV